MRLGKAQRLALRQERLVQYARRRRVDREIDTCGNVTVNPFRRGQSLSLVSIGGSLVKGPSVGTSKPGANLYKETVPYSIPRPPRLGSVVKSKGYARFANS